MNTPSIPECSILIADDIHPVFFDLLKDVHCTLDYRPDITYEQALEAIPLYEGLVVRSKFKVGPAFFGQARQLRFIGRAGAGVDNIDAAAAAARNITLLSAPEGNCDAVAEHMMGMLLALMNHLPGGYNEIRSGIWHREENRGIELGGKTVGLIGYGNNGRAMARKLSGFDVQVLAYDKYRTAYSDTYAREADLLELQQQADVLSLHIPLTTETRNWVDQTFLNSFKKPVILLNGSRGETVVIEDLLRAMDQGQVLGAALDVLPVETFPALGQTSWYAELIARPNVLLSPHVAGWTVESYYKIAQVLGRKIASLLTQ